MGHGGNNIIPNVHFRPLGLLFLRSFGERFFYWFVWSWGDDNQEKHVWIYLSYLFVQKNKSMMTTFLSFCVNLSGRTCRSHSVWAKTFRTCPPGALRKRGRAAHGLKTYELLRKDQRMSVGSQEPRLHAHLVEPGGVRFVLLRR